MKFKHIPLLIGSIFSAGMSAAFCCIILSTLSCEGVPIIEDLEKNITKFNYIDYPGSCPPGVYFQYMVRIFIMDLYTANCSKNIRTSF
jgi:hypothetical protein